MLEMTDNRIKNTVSLRYFRFLGSDVRFDRCLCACIVDHDRIGRLSESPDERSTDPVFETEDDRKVYLVRTHGNPNDEKWQFQNDK